jgi:hypothetical protein
VKTYAGTETYNLSRNIMTGRTYWQSPARTRLFALFVLAAAMLPNILYIGHWGPPTAAAHSHSQAAHHQPAPEADEHAQHCHTGPAKCAGPQALAGAIWVGEDAGLLGLNTTPRIIPISEELYVLDSFGSRLLQPPREAA